MPVNPKARTMDPDIPVGESDRTDEQTAVNGSETGSTAAMDAYRHFFHQMAQGAFILAADGRFIDVNQAALDLLGLTRDQFLGRTALDPAWQVLREDGSEWPGADRPAMQALTTGQPVVDAVAGVFNPAIEEFIWLSINVIPLFRPGESRPYQLFGTFYDITERVRQDSTLRESEKKFRLLSENTMDAIWLMDLGLVFQYVNPAVETILGFSPAEWVGSRLTERTSAEQMAAMTEIILDAWKDLPENTNVLFETEFLHKDGHPVPVEIHGTFLLDQNNQPIGLQGVTRDITDRRRAEIARQLAHQRFLTVLDGIEATIYVADMDTHEIIFMNRYMQETFGGDFTGQICHQAFRGQPVPCDACTNDRIVNADGRPDGVYTWEDQNPVTGRWYINYDRAIDWVDGRIVRLQVATDITRLKTLEAERLQYENRLNQAQKLEAIGTLAGGIAHDFNNILASVLGFTELATDMAPDGSTLQEYLNEVYAAGLRARDLVRQILTFSRQQQPDIKAIDFPPLVTETLRMLRATIPTTITIQTHISESPLIIEGDPSQIHQILLNLATNAAHAMEDNGGTLTVSLAPIAVDEPLAQSNPGLRPGRYGRLTVKDTGCGIPVKHLPAIFDPYFTTKSPDQGSGLGLSVVHGIVKAHQGHITISSSVDTGTTIQVYLPLTDQQTTIDHSHHDSVLPSGSEHILVVDDEPTIAKILQQSLERLGYTVTTAIGSSEAFALFEADPDRYQLVVTDMTMPTMTGDLLCRSMKAVRSDIPVVLTTGFSERISSQSLSEFGVDSFLMKPVNREELARTIRNLIDRKHMIETKG